MNLRGLRHWARGVWMFLRVVFRDWEGQRVGPIEAWEIASTVWLDDFSIEFRVWCWLPAKKAWVAADSDRFQSWARATKTRRRYQQRGVCTAISREVV